MAEWRNTTWDEVATLEYGKSLRDYAAPAKYRVYGTNGPIGWHDKPLCDEPGVIIGRKGAYRGIHYSPEPFFVIDTAFYLKPKIQIHPRWAYYQLLTQDINGIDSGSAIPSTSRSDFYALPLELPPLSEQKAIAAVLGSLDDKIELNRRMNATLEAMARALFQSWFVDFDPVRAKLDRRQPTGLDPATAALFPNEFEDSELGPIPKGWKVGKVGNIVSFSRSTIDPSEFPDELFEHYSLPAFDEGRIPKLEIGGAIKSQKLLVYSDAVLLSKLNPHIPRIWLPDVTTKQRAICSTEFLVAQPGPDVSRQLLFCLFTNGTFAAEFATLVTGTTGSHQRVKGESVLEMKLVIPPAKLGKVFSVLAHPVFRRISQNIRASSTIAAVRDTLLPKLLSGEVRTSLN